jgi:site-specific recombinase XerD
MRSTVNPSVDLGEARPEVLEAALARLFGDGVRPLRLEEAIFDAMLEGWARQQRSRMLREATIGSGVRLVRRVRASAERWPWEWTAEDLEDFVSDLASAPHYRRPATLRNYQSQLRGFLGFLVDERYPWRLVCGGCFGRVPVQLLDEYNAIVHAGEHESDPRRRALTREELQSLFDLCDRRVAGRRALRRKGSLAALRDGAMFKVCYGWGLRRTELVGLDVCDLLANPAQPRFAGGGILRVRHGKGSRGSAPKRRDVLTVWGWAAAVLEQYVSEIRPLFGFDEHPALWLTERGGRISGRHVDERFAELRDELGMDRVHSPHALRHSYVTHLHEEGFDPLFVKEQVGHRYMSTTALYTGVSSDYKQRALAAALDAQLSAIAGLR